MANIFLSIPLSYNLSQFLRNISPTASQHNVKYWDRDEFYQNSWIEQCNAFCVAHPSNKFSFVIDELPKGCYKELKKAIDLNKPILLLYENSDGLINFYKTRIEKKFNSLELSGYPGSTKVLNEFSAAEAHVSRWCTDSSCSKISREETELKDRMVIQSSKDIRLLLLT